MSRRRSYKVVDGKYEHRLVASDALGRELRPDEYVHHRNGDPRDNRPENLQVVSPAEHNRIHAEERGMASDAAIASMLRLGKSAKETARELRVSTHRIVRVRHAHGIAPLQGGAARRFDRDEAARLRAAGASIGEISRRLGVTKSAVSGALCVDAPAIDLDARIATLESELSVLRERRARLDCHQPKGG